jgi:catechol 2,3-dioxygenase-like lactoylglutathione lyase family enzyme
VRFSQVRLLVDDYGDTVRVLGSRVLGVEASFGDASSGYASFRLDGGALAIFARDEQAETLGLQLPGDGALVVLEVDDVDAEVARLGDRVIAGPTDRPDWGGRVASLRDPSGNPIELFQAIPMTG